MPADGPCHVCGHRGACLVWQVEWANKILVHAKGNHFKFKKYFQVHYEFDQLTRQGGSYPHLAGIWRAVPHLNATISARDQCCTPALPPQRSMPRYSVRHAKQGYCQPLSSQAKDMIDSGQIPVIKGIAKGNACKGHQHDVDPPKGSILAYLVALAIGGAKKAPHDLPD